MTSLYTLFLFPLLTCILEGMLYCCFLSEKCVVEKHKRCPHLASIAKFRSGDCAAEQRQARMAFDVVKPPPLPALFPLVVAFLLSASKSASYRSLSYNIRERKHAEGEGMPISKFPLSSCRSQVLGHVYHFPMSRLAHGRIDLLH